MANIIADHAANFVPAQPHILAGFVWELLHKGCDRAVAIRASISITLLNGARQRYEFGATIFPSARISDDIEAVIPTFQAVGDLRVPAQDPER